MSTFTTRVVVDDGTEFSPSVELCVEDRRGGRTRLVAVSGQLVSHADIDGMAAMAIDELREWAREAKAKLAGAQALAVGGRWRAEPNAPRPLSANRVVGRGAVHRRRGV